MKKNNWIVAQLTDQGHKITASRKQIITVLKKLPGLFNASDIERRVKDMDRTTVYRTIELLEEVDVIHRVGVVAGHVLYELHQKDNHHHHILCRVCHISDCIPCKQVKISVPGFVDIHHATIFTGICTKCQKK